MIDRNRACLFWVSPEQALRALNNSSSSCCNPLIQRINCSALQRLITNPLRDFKILRGFCGSKVKWTTIFLSSIKEKTTVKSYIGQNRGAYKHLGGSTSQY
nr:pre-CP [Soybean stay-green associated virus]